MAAKLLAALNRITLEDVIPGRASAVSGSVKQRHLSAEGTTKINEGRDSPFDEARYCSLCALKFNSEEQLDQHLKGKRHEKSVRRSNISDNKGENYPRPTKGVL